MVRLVELPVGNTTVVIVQAYVGNRYNMLSVMQLPYNLPTTDKVTVVTAGFAQDFARVYTLSYGAVYFSYDSCRRRHGLEPSAPSRRRQYASGQRIAKYSACFSAPKEM